MRTIARTFQTTIINSTIASRFRLMRSVAIAALVLAGATQTQATALIWTNSSGTLSSAFNWDPAQAPVDGDETFYTNDTSYTVSLSANSPLIMKSTVSNHAGVVTFNPNGLLWSVTNTFRVGVADSTSTVYVVGGGTLSVASFTAPFVGAQLRIADTTTNLFSCVATMTVGPGTTVGADACIIGAASNSVGTLIINGGTYSDLGASGSGSTLTVGASSSGNQLIVSNGGKLFVDGTLTVGNNLNASNNFMLMTGSGTAGTLTTAGIKLSGNGGGFIISNGASLFIASPNGGTLGANSSWNTGIVVGVNSSLIVGGNFQVGVNSSGGTNNTLLVYDGAFFSCGGTLAMGNNSFHVNDGILMGGPGLMSTGSAIVVRDNSTITNHFGNYLIVSNAFFSCSYLNPQGPVETIAVLDKGTFLLTNSSAISSAANSNSVNLNSNAGCPPGTTLLINRGTLNNPLTADNGGGISVGGNGGLALIITNGGKVLSSMGTIGAGSTFNTGIVAGVGSVWSNFSVVADFTNILIVGTGAAGSNNFLGVFDGGHLINGGTLAIGNGGFTAVVNTVRFGGPGNPVFVNNVGSLNIGQSGGSYSNSLYVTNATVNAGTINVGNSSASNNLLQINGGTISASYLRARPTNNVVFTGGTLNLGAISFDSLANWTSDSVTNPLVVGDGVSTAYYNMTNTGSGYHDFHDGGLVISVNATLGGSGTIMGNVIVNGTFAPGGAGLVGSVFASNTMIFAGTAALNYDLGTLSSDSVTVTNNLGLGGTLNIASSGSFGMGDYTIFSYGGVLTNNGTLSVGLTPNGSLTYVIDTNTLGFVKLHVTSGVVVNPWQNWQTFYFPAGGPSSAGNVDADGDGVSNTNEFLSGFNPTNSAAYAHVIAIVKSNTDMRVTYLGANGDSLWSPGIASRTNVLEFTIGWGVNGSYTNNFVSVTGGTNIYSGGTGLGTNVTAVDAGGATGATRYYRIRVIAP